MNDIHDENSSVYEIGYLIVSSIPEEKIPEEAEAIKKIITSGGSSVIAEGAPERQQLAYTMRKKTVSGSYDTYDVAYFGWVKFEVGSDKIEAIKKAVEIYPSVLRSLLVSTVRENTYLGKRAPVFATSAASNTARRTASENVSGDKVEDKKDEAPATIEEMDKSIDEMVKEV